MLIHDPYGDKSITTCDDVWTVERLRKVIRACCEYDAIEKLEVLIPEGSQELSQYLIARIGDLKVKSLVLDTSMLWAIDNDSVFWPALNSNFCIEDLKFVGDDRPRKEDTLYYMYLNKAGRRILQDDSFNPKLWPLVLERVNTMNYENDDDEDDDSYEEFSYIPSVMFAMVKQGLAQTQSIQESFMLKK